MHSQTHGLAALCSQFNSDISTSMAGHELYACNYFNKAKLLALDFPT